MKVLVTGASGFIGQHCLPKLQAKGFEVHAVSSVSRSGSGFVHWHQGDLLDRVQTAALVRSVRPTHLLHLAWYAKPGKYWTSRENLDWVQTSLTLMQTFAEIGGQRLVTAGTCAEYDWNHGTCVEGHTPTLPATLYGSCKHALQLIQQAWCTQSGLSNAWGRVFSLYGPAEYPERLVASIVRALLHGQPARCGNAALVRDYLHAEDVASAFVEILQSEIEGPVNIGSGQAISLRELVGKIATKIGNGGLVEFPVPPVSSNEPAMLLPDITRLLSTGWKRKFDLDAGLDDTIAWWRGQPGMSGA